MKSTACLVAVAIVVAAFVRPVLAIDDGVYLVERNDNNGELQMQGGHRGVIERRLLAGEYSLKISPTENDNSEFKIGLLANKDVAVSSDGEMVIAANQRVYRIWSMRPAILVDCSDGKKAIVTHELAERLMAAAGETLRLRHHPAHQLEVKFVLDKKSFQIGEDVAISVIVKNLGLNAVILNANIAKEPGRSPSFLVSPRSPDSSIIDRREWTQEAELFKPIEIGPGSEEIIYRGNLLNYFEPSKKGRFQFAAMHQLRFYAGLQDSESFWVEWSGDLIEFEIE